MKIVNFAVSSIYGAIVLLLLLDLKPFIIFIANGIVTSTSKYDIDPYLVIEKIILGDGVAGIIYRDKIEIVDL